jgi:hypothetical protein
MKIVRRLDADIDRLYALPLEEFTAARNALAKQAGTDGSAIRELEKPSIAAWAVNQLYWRNREEYDALVDAADKVRSAHRAMLSGRGGDVRDSGQEHEKQIESAIKATLATLAEQGHPVTDATKQAIVTTLRALPGSDAPGRLTRPLQPAGFEMLSMLRAGAAGGRTESTAAREPPPRKTPPATTGKTAAKKVDAKALARARETASSTARAVQAATHALKQAEFEYARTAREADKAARELADARQALETAQQRTEDAEISASKADKARGSAERRRDEAEAKLDAARARADMAQKEVDSLQRD